MTNFDLSYSLSRFSVNYLLIKIKFNQILIDFFIVIIQEQSRDNAMHREKVDRQLIFWYKINVWSRFSIIFNIYLFEKKLKFQKITSHSWISFNWVDLSHLQKLEIKIKINLFIFSIVWEKKILFIYKIKTYRD